MSITLVVRVWIADRPGALGSLASRIGAVGGDVLGIEILESGAGRVIDELLVRLPDEDLLDLLVAEIQQLGDVDVESVRNAPVGAHDATVTALEAAAAISSGRSVTEILVRLIARTTSLVDAEWGVVIDHPRGLVITSTGTPPSTPWLLAFVGGAIAAGLHEEISTSGDIVCFGIDGSRWCVIGRDGRDLRWREQREVALLVEIASNLIAGDQVPDGSVDGPVE